MKVKIVSVDTVAKLRWLKQQLLTHPVIALDIETACDRKTKGAKVPLAHDVGARIVSCSFTWGVGQAAVVPLSHRGAGTPWHKQWPGVFTRLVEALHEPRGRRAEPARLVAHNAPYDLGWVTTHTGVDLSQLLWWDTQAGAFVLDENSPHGLKDIGRDLGFPAWAIDLSDPEATPWRVLCRYNGLDTIVTWQAMGAQFNEISHEEALWRLMMRLLMPVQRVYLDIEQHGLPIDLELTKSRRTQAMARIDQLEAYLLEHHTPADLINKHGWTDHKVPRRKKLSWAPTSKFFNEWMERKNAPVIELTPKGKPSWKDTVLDQLERLEEHRVWVTPLREHRSLTKEVSAFLDPWIAMAEVTGGLLYPRYKIATVVTGRTASEYPNAQQIPKSLRPLFVAPEGYVWFQADYAQIELRVAAWLAGDRAMLAAFQRGDDLHRLMAARIADLPPEQVSREQRQHAKAVNFGFLYGMGARKFTDYAEFQYGVRYTLEEATEIRRIFFETWADLEAWHERQRKLAWINGSVRTPFGRRRRLPDVRSTDEHTRAMAERQAINSPVQATGSDLMLLAIIETDRRWREDGLDAQILGSVHDAMIGIIREEHLEPALSHLGASMTKPPTRELFGFDIPVPLEVEVELGPAWAVADDIRVIKGENAQPVVTGV